MIRPADERWFASTRVAMDGGNFSAPSRSIATRAAAIEGRLRDVDAQMALAGRLQRDLLTGPVPEIHGARIETLFRPASPLSGDMFRVQRVGESRVAITIIDPTGHGLPAAMLSMYINAIVEAGGGRRAGDPAALLRDLNRVLIESQLEDCFFLAALHAVYDESTRIIRWARGGIPHPLLSRAAGFSPRDGDESATTPSSSVPRTTRCRHVAPVSNRCLPGTAGSIRVAPVSNRCPPRTTGPAPRDDDAPKISRIESEGTIIGAVPDAQFEVVERQLAPGDRILFHTDGLDAFLLGDEIGSYAATPTNHRWIARLTGPDSAAHLRTLDRQIRDTRDDQWQSDDVTIVALEIDPPTT